MWWVEFEQKIGYHFSDRDKLIKALTHRSVNPLAHYERQEYLGDALLNSVVSYWLFLRSQLPEGVLSQQRSLLVCEGALELYAKQCDLDRYIQCSPALQQSRSVVADSFEALCAAIFLDSDWATLSQWIIKHFEPLFENRLAHSNCKDFKTQLQEYTQQKAQVLPEYHLKKRTGHDHDPHFEIACRFQDFVTYGQGSSKKIAQQQAAQNMLMLLYQSKDTL